MSTTPYMNLLLPIPTVTLGPLYANELNNALTFVDSHNHTAGQGVPVPAIGLNINADLPINGNNLTIIRSSRYQDQPSPLSLVSDITCIYSSGGNLYWNNASGAQVQITAGAALNAASIGGIGGDYTTSGASLFYLTLTKTFYFTQAANTAANLDGGSVTIREPVLNAKGITLASPTALAADYSITLPTGLPAFTGIVTMTSSGNLAAIDAADETSLTQVAGILSIKTGGVTQDKLAPRPTGTTVGAGGVGISAGSGSVVNGSTSYATAGIPVTITTTGRPVFVGIIADGDSESFLELNASSAVSQDASIAFVRDLVVVNSQRILSYSGNTSTSWPASSFSMIDPIGAGTYTYNLSSKINISGGGRSLTLQSIKLIVYEL